jgi:hypothetical protein
LLAAACNAPRVALGPSDQWSPGGAQVGINRIVGYVLDTAGAARRHPPPTGARSAAQLAAEGNAIGNAIAAPDPARYQPRPDTNQHRTPTQRRCV